MRRRAWRSVRLAAALLTAAAGLVALSGSPAAAHASLIGSSPANGAELDEPPDAIRLRFTEQVTPAPGGIELRRSDGSVVATEPAFSAPEDPTQVVQPVPGDLPDGGYVVTFRVVSADSHPISGSIVFGVGAPPASIDVAQLISGDSAVATVFMLARWTSYAGLALLAGALVVFVLCWPGGWANQRARRVVAVGWVASVGGGLASLLLEGPYGAGRSLSSIVDGELLATTLGTDYGTYVLARLGLCLAAGSLLLSRRPSEVAPAAESATATTGSRLLPPETRWRDGLALAIGVALPATWVGTGHANTAGAVDTVADVAHLVAMSTWFGGLALLAICLLPRSTSSFLTAAEVGTALRRFSMLAVGAVAILLVTGVYLAWRRVGTLDALIGTQYGRLLAFKLAGMGVLLWLGSLSRSVVQRRYQSSAAPVGTPGPTTRSKRRAARDAEAQERVARVELGRSVRVEVGLGVVVLAVVSVLVATPPGVVLTAAEELAQEPAQPVLESLPLDGDATVRVLVDPAWVGQNRVVVEVVDGGGAPLDVPEVRASFVLSEGEIGPLPVELEQVEPGVFSAPTTPLPFAGAWQLNVTVRTTEFDSTTVQVPVPVR
jgi:copper transport protein